MGSPLLDSWVNVCLQLPKKIICTACLKIHSLHLHTFLLRRCFSSMTQRNWDLYVTRGLFLSLSPSLSFPGIRMMNGGSYSPISPIVHLGNSWLIVFVTAMLNYIFFHYSFLQPSQLSTPSTTAWPSVWGCVCINIFTMRRALRLSLQKSPQEVFLDCWLLDIFHQGLERVLLGNVV